MVEWWKKIPDSKDYGATKNIVRYSYEICINCEGDLVDGKCPLCDVDKDE